MSTIAPPKPVSKLEEATVRFCGDSGDGMQLAGTQFTNTSALAGNDVATFPDFPAEIRAPRGTKAGVSGFQIHFSSTDIYTPGDTVDGLVAMNPAALTTNLSDLRDGGILIVNKDAFDKKGLEQAGYETNPLEDGSLEQKYQLYAVEMTKLNRLAVEGLGLAQKEADRCRNFFAMGLVFWLYDRALEPTLRFIDAEVRQEARGRRGEHRQRSRPATTTAKRPKAIASAVPGAAGEARRPASTATSWATRPWPGAWSRRRSCRSKRLFLGGYPITPASDILHELSSYKNFGVRTFQAEDEIAAITVGDRRGVRRRDGGHRLQRPRHRAQGRRHGPGRDDRAADADHQRAARRPDARACRPRPSRPTCCRPCAAATANARCR